MSTRQFDAAILNLSLEEDLLEPGKSDSEQRFVGYASYLRRADFLLAAKTDGHRNINSKISVTAVSGPPLLKLIRLIVVGFIMCRKNKLNLIVANDPLIGVVGILVRILNPGTKLVVNILGLEITSRYWLAQNPVGHRLLRQLELWVLRKADAVRSDSRRAIRELSRLSISKRKMYYVPMIPSEKIITQLKKRGNKGYSGDKKYDLLNIGSLVWQKGQAVLLDALALVVKKQPGVKLTIIGDGPEKNNLLYKVRRLNLGDNVIFLGAVSYANLPKYYLKCKILVVSSYYEGGPRVVMEAAFCATPVVSSDVGSVGDMLTDRKSVLIVPVGQPEMMADAISCLLASESKQQMMAKIARKQIGKYCDPESNLRATVSLWRKVLTEL